MNIKSLWGFLFYIKYYKDEKISMKGGGLYDKISKSFKRVQRAVWGYDKRMA